MIARTIRFLAGILLIPGTIAYSGAFYEQLIAIRQIRTPELALLLGITAYLAVHAVLGAPTRVYVFGHELTHAAATWVSGGEVKSVRVGSKKGSVVTNKVTTFIALAPYLIPVYSVVWALLYGAAALVWNFRYLSGWFFFGLGVTLAFHLVFTATVLKEKQSDLDAVGPVVGLCLIYWTNLTVVVGIMSLMISEVQFWPYVTGGFARSQNLYLLIFKQLFS